MNVEKVAAGNSASLSSLPSFLKQHHPLGLPYRQRLQEDRIHNAEYRRVRPYPNGKRDHRHNGERRRLAQEAGAVAEVLDPSVHDSPFENPWVH